MTPDNFYWYASILIFIPWFALIFAPNWKWTETLASSSAIILLVASTWFTVRYLLHGDDGGHVFSFSGLQNLFRSTEMLLTGWFNYLAFGLLTGIWQSNDAAKQKIPHIWVLPCLILTMLTGAAGLLLYIGIRWVRTRGAKI